MHKWILTDLARQVGHSRAAAGLHSADTIVITPTKRQGKQMGERFDVKTASLVQGTNGYFQGRPVPVVFDTEAVQKIVQSYEDQLTKLREQLGVGTR